MPIFINKRPTVVVPSIAQDPYVNTISEHDEMAFTRAEKVQLSNVFSGNIAISGETNARIEDVNYLHQTISGESLTRASEIDRLHSIITGETVNRNTDIENLTITINTIDNHTSYGLEKSRRKLEIASGISAIQSQFLLENCIYYINYEYDLSGGTLNIPNNSTLVFNGGVIKNGTLSGSFIINSKDMCFVNLLVTGGIIGETYTDWWSDSEIWNALYSLLRCANSITLGRSKTYTINTSLGNYFNTNLHVNGNFSTINTTLNTHFMDFSIPSNGVVTLYKWENLNINYTNTLTTQKDCFYITSWVNTTTQNLKNFIFDNVSIVAKNQTKKDKDNESNCITIALTKTTYFDGLYILNSSFSSSRFCVELFMHDSGGSLFNETIKNINLNNNDFTYIYQDVFYGCTSFSTHNHSRGFHVDNNRFKSNVISVEFNGINSDIYCNNNTHTNCFYQFSGGEGIPVENVFITNDNFYRDSIYGKLSLGLVKNCIIDGLNIVLDTTGGPGIFITPQNVIFKNANIKYNYTSTGLTSADYLIDIRQEDILTINTYPVVLSGNTITSVNSIFDNSMVGKTIRYNSTDYMLTGYTSSNKMIITPPYSGSVSIDSYGWGILGSVDYNGITMDNINIINNGLETNKNKVFCLMDGGTINGLNFKNVVSNNKHMLLLHEGVGTTIKNVIVKDSSTNSKYTNLNLQSDEILRMQFGENEISTNGFNQLLSNSGGTITISGHTVSGSGTSFDKNLVGQYLKISNADYLINYVSNSSLIYLNTTPGDQVLTSNQWGIYGATKNITSTGFTSSNMWMNNGIINTIVKVPSVTELSIFFKFKINSLNSFSGSTTNFNVIKLGTDINLEFRPDGIMLFGTGFGGYCGFDKRAINYNSLIGKEHIFGISFKNNETVKVTIDGHFDDNYITPTVITSPITNGEMLLSVNTNNGAISISDVYILEGYRYETYLKYKHLISEH